MDFFGHNQESLEFQDAELADLEKFRLVGAQEISFEIDPELLDDWFESAVKDFLREFQNFVDPIKEEMKRLSNLKETDKTKAYREQMDLQSFVDQYVCHFITELELWTAIRDDSLASGVASSIRALKNRIDGTLMDVESGICDASRELQL